MNEQHGERSPTRLRLRDWIQAHAALMSLVFVAGVVGFVVYSGSLTNRFAATVREERLGAVAIANLSMLPAYALVALYHALLSFPIARLFASASRSFWTRLAHAVWTSVVVLALSLGPLTLVTTGPIDMFARGAARLDAGLDLYGFVDSGAYLAFTAVYGVLALFAMFHLLLRVTAWLGSLAPKARRFAVGGAVLTLAVPLFSLDRLPAQIKPGEQKKRPHVIVIASDSLRADHLGIHGYPRNVSPNLDALARESVDFRDCHVATASTIESWTSFLTGRWPANHGIRYMFVTKQHADAVATSDETLPRRLGEIGYRTFVCGDWVANCFDVLDFGFAGSRVSRTQNLGVFLSEIALRIHVLVTLYFGAGWGESLIPNLAQATAVIAPDRIVDDFVDRILASDRAGEPAFGVLFLSCTHLPFMSPYPFNRKFVDPAYRGANRYRIDFDVDAFMREGFSDAQSDAERQHVVDLYDGGVAWFDQIVGEVAKRLRDEGVLDESIVVVTSDHGDDLYEPGTTLGHGTNFFGGDQSTRIPLFIRLPNGEHGGRTVDSIVRGVDLKATILDLVEHPAKTKVRSDGVSLRPLLDGSQATLDLAAFAETCYLFFQKKPIIDGANKSVILRPADETLRIDPTFRDQLVLEERWHDPVIRAKDRMIRTERWKLIRIEGERGPIWRLFDMATDPTQTRDRSRDGLPIFDRLRERLEKWIADGTATTWDPALDES